MATLQTQLRSYRVNTVKSQQCKDSAFQCEEPGNRERMSLPHRIPRNIQSEVLKILLAFKKLHLDLLLEYGRALERGWASVPQ